MLCQAIAECQDHNSDHSYLTNGSSKTGSFITLFYLICSVLQLKYCKDHYCQHTCKYTGQIDGAVPKEIGDIAIRTATEQIYESGTILNGYCHTLQDYVTQATECQHTCQCYDERRDSHISDPEALESTDQGTDHEHDQDCQPHVHLHVHHEDCTDGSDKTYYRSDGQINVTAGQDTQ